MKQEIFDPSTIHIRPGSFTDMKRQRLLELLCLLTRGRSRIRIRIQISEPARSGFNGYPQGTAPTPVAGRAELRMIDEKASLPPGRAEPSDDDPTA